MGTLSSIGSSLVSAAQFALPAKEARDSSVEINLKNKQLEQSAAYQKQKNLLALNTSETERQSKLRKALSTQRANFGSQGIGSATGSAEAVLQGTFADSDIERQQKQAATERDNAAIDANLASQKQLNLLQKQQLQQKATLGYLTDLF
jgi:hypothetical protein